MVKPNSRLSVSLEDYLEAIYNLSQVVGKARVKDIALELGVKMPSVSGALKSLIDKGLVIHRPYESVELTEQGSIRASEVVGRHGAVKDFLMNMLGLEESRAEAEACGIEHAIADDTLERLAAFVRRIREHDAAETPMCIAEPQTRATLDQLCPGTRGRIVSTRGAGAIRKRMLEMGLNSGTELEVIRMAPLGDPVEVRVRGYLLSLRKSEARMLTVEIAESVGSETVDDGN